MHNRIALMLLVLGGCDGLADEQTEGVALATLRGTLALGPDVKPPGASLHVSVLWQDPAFGHREANGGISFRGDDPVVEDGCHDGQATGWSLETPLLEQPVRVDTDFPSGFSVTLTEPPPAASLFEYPDGPGAVALGDLVVYEDRNGNGRLDPSTFDVTSPDRVFGSSKGASPFGVGQRKHYMIVYLTEDIDRGDGDGKAGFSIVTSGSDPLDPVLRRERLSEAMIDLTLDPTTYVQQMACSVFCQLSALELVDDAAAFLRGDLGTKVSDLGVGAGIWSRQDSHSGMFTLVRCTKENREELVSYGLNIDVVISEGCNETSSSLAQTLVAYPDTDVDTGCTEYGEVDKSAFPTVP